MVICESYKHCMVRTCKHRLPHIETWDCVDLQCPEDKNSICMEEIYVYMKEAIEETSSIDIESPV